MLRACFTVLCVCCLALNVVYVGAAAIKHEKSAPVEPARSLWKPSKPVRLSNEVFCFTAEDGGCQSGSCAETLLCTFDGGKRVTSVEATLPYCGDRGVVVEGQLYCPSAQLPSPEKNVIVFSLVAFAPKDKSSLNAVVSVEKQFRFTFPKEGKRSYDKLTLGVTAPVLADDAESFFLPAIVVDSNGTEASVMFTSKDGFSWHYLSKLPFKTPVKGLYAVQMGRQKLDVISQTVDGKYERATSRYRGKWWSDVKKLNATAPPFSLSYPSSLTVEYGMTNSTPLSASYHAEENPKKARQTVLLSGPSTQLGKAKDDKAKEGAGSSSYAVAFQSAPDRILAFYDAPTVDGKKQLQMSSFSVDDSEEKKIMERRKEEEAKRKAEKEAARVKAQIERQERQAKERREKRLKELARRKAFEEADAPNIKLAEHNYEIDGDYVVVRPTKKETLDLEKSTFFW